jgi:hypothetical protein
MITEALSAGFYQPPVWMKTVEYPRIQILSIADLLHGTAQIKIPSETRTFKQAPKIKQQSEHMQAELEI